MRRWFSRLLETVRCIVHPTVSRQRAVELARAEFERRGWPFPGPRVKRVDVEWGLLCRRVRLVSTDISPGVLVKVDKRDGTIRDIVVPPR